MENNNQITAIGNDNFIVITGWMMNELHLTGNELITYALIYGLSQYGKKNGFFGSINTIAKWTGIKSDKTVRTILKTLLDKKLITRSSLKVNGQESYIYFAVKYNDNSLEQEITTRNYRDVLADYAAKHGFEFKQLKKELVIKDYIDIETLEINESQKENFAEEYPALFEAYILCRICENQDDDEKISDNTTKEKTEKSNENPIFSDEKHEENEDNERGAVKITDLYKTETIQQTSPVKITGGCGKNYRRGAVEFTDNTINTNLNTTTAAGNINQKKQSDENTIHEPAAASSQIQNIKNILEQEFSTSALPFDDSFYSKILEECIKYSLSVKEIQEYIRWSVSEVLKKPKDNVFDYYYSTAAKPYFVSRFINFKLSEAQKKAEDKQAAENKQTLDFITCPVCQVKHDKSHKCPSCELPENSVNDEQEISNYTIRFKLKKPERRQLDIELTEHEGKRPQSLSEMTQFIFWKKKRNEIFQKYKK